MPVHFLGKKSRPKTLTRTIVLDNPKKSLVIWDNIVLKEVMAGQYRTANLEKSE